MEKEIHLICENCGREVSVEKDTCPYCKSSLGDIECPKCSYLGTPSQFKNGCPKCNYNPFNTQVFFQKGFYNNKNSTSRIKLPIVFSTFLILIVSFGITLLFLILLIMDIS